MSNKKLCVLISPFLFLILLATACAKKHVVYPPAKKEKGIASWYGPGFHGRRTASGERYNQNKMTAAHRALPFGTLVKIINLDNYKSAIVKINDRGPHCSGRIIDVSKAAARALDFIGRGTARVILFYLSDGKEAA